MPTLEDAVNRANSCAMIKPKMADINKTYAALKNMLNSYVTSSLDVPSLYPYVQSVPIARYEGPFHDCDTYDDDEDEAMDYRKIAEDLKTTIEKDT